MGKLKDRIKTNKVSKDLRHKYIAIIGAEKTGKTSLAVQFPNNLMFCVEKGINALDGVDYVDCHTWKLLKDAVKDLDDPEIQKEYFTITIDTATLAYDKCREYILKREGADSLSEVAHGDGYNIVDREFYGLLQDIVNLGYGLVVICHTKERVETDGKSSVKYVDIDGGDRLKKIINRMVDLTAHIYMDTDGKRYVYPRATTFQNGNQTVNLYAGNHFANLNERFELSYDNLVNAVSDALTTEAKEKKYVLSEAPIETIKEEVLDFNAIKDGVGNYALAFKAADDELEKPVHFEAYKTIVTNILGEGKRAKDCTSSQVEHLALILEDLKDYAEKNNIKC